MTTRLTKPGHRHIMMATIEIREDLNGAGNKYRKYKTEADDR
jgi:hypothetical protein